MRFLLIILFLLYPCLSCSESRPVVFIDAQEIKKQKGDIFFDDSISVNLNNNDVQDGILYTYSDFPPKLIIDIMVDGEKKEIGLICESIGFAKGETGSMKNLFCGPKFILKWDGKTYREHLNK